MDVDGGQILVDNNPPPSTDTVTQFYLKHFMALLSEENFPITSVISYSKEIGITQTELFINLMLRAYGHYRKKMDDRMRKKNG
jgi:hypothetical protein